MAEKNLVVDKDDNVIGVKIRSEIARDEIYRVSALWLTNSKGEILLAQRAWSKDKNPGKWGPAVAGTVAQGETYEENIIKETEEEIGLVGATLTVGPKVFRDENHRYFCQWYTAQVDKPLQEFTIPKDEVEQIAWVSREQLQKELQETPEKFVPSAIVWQELFLK